MKLPLRSEVKEELKWDITRLYKDIDAVKADIKSASEIADKMAELKNLKTKEELKNFLDLYEELMIKVSRLSTYSELISTTDMTDTDNVNFANTIDMSFSPIFEKISFVENLILSLDEKIIDDYKKTYEDYHVFLDSILRMKGHVLSDEESKVFASLSYALNGPYNTYEISKLADMKFDSFEVDGKTYENSYVLFENFYQYHEDLKVRRAAFESFSKTLENYKNTTASLYEMYLNIEKTKATMCGFDSLIDYHLFGQDVKRELYDRQIDVIMEDLAPIMRKFEKLVQKFYGIDEMHFADLKLPIDKEFSKEISEEDSWKYVEEALSVMGDEYLKVAMSAKTDRWVDFASNVGKSTGGFCSSPYKKGSYILLSWTREFAELYTLVHEIGHGVHFRYAQENNKALEEEPSLYFIESPSTCNEILLSKYLLKNTTDERFRRYILANMITNTYFHNFVTHLLEAHYQREVYYLVDKGEPINADILSELKLNTLKKFWGDEIVMDKGAELTWMRQPHYFMGLYSYTYSAGLTISTNAANNIYEKEDGAKNWIEALKAGGTLKIEDLAKLGGVDISTDAALKNTIAYIGSIVDELEKLI